MRKIAIIGYGAVAAYLSAALRDSDTDIVAALARPGREAAARSVLRCDTVLTRAEALPSGLDCVVDCGGHAALRAHGATILAAGTDLITVSLGALADADLHRDLIQAAEAGQSRLHLATGAIGGLDALSAAAAGRLERVTYTGRKPPAGWAGSPAETTLDLSTLDAPGMHFDGTARDCALAYPKNANVAAAVALAGLGMDATRARLIADPAIDRNVHEITAEGDFGRFTFTIEGRGLPDNPKSSALTAMSLVHALARRHTRVGF